MKVLIACEYSGTVRDAFIGGGTMRYHVTCYQLTGQGRITKVIFLTSLIKVGI